MSQKHFTRDERVKLACLLKTRIKKKEIADILDKDTSSIYRELSRNSEDGKYLPSKAEKKRKQRRSRLNKKRKRIEKDPILRRYIVKKLKLYWSPEQIVGRFKDR